MESVFCFVLMNIWQLGVLVTSSCIYDCLFFPLITRSALTRGPINCILTFDIDLWPWPSMPIELWSWPYTSIRSGSEVTWFKRWSENGGTDGWRNVASCINLLANVVGTYCTWSFLMCSRHVRRVCVCVIVCVFWRRRRRLHSFLHFNHCHR